MKTINDLFKQSKQEWLDEARDTARKIGATKSTFTIEDVLLACPLPKYLHHNTIGSVFKHEDFKSVGFAPSRRPAMHGRVVRKWTLTFNENEVRSRLWRFSRSEAMVE